MRLRRLGIIGAGGIAEVVASTLARQLVTPLEHVSFIIIPEFVSQATELFDRTGEQLAASRSVRTDLNAFLADQPQLVSECASHAAVREYGPGILSAGVDLMIISIGALCEDRLRASLEKAARAGGSQILLPSGAIGGIDALAAARLSGLESVIYTGRKPPDAWRGTPAERLLDLNGLREAIMFYEGNARDAARTYPFNANVTAMLALAGIGFDQTRVRLIADPGVMQNVHEFAVRAGTGEFTIRLEGRPSPANPKTSLMAGYSIARNLLNRTGPIVI